jgi:hypothetical protein
LLDGCRQICHGIDDKVGSRVGKALGEFPVCVARARETDRGHAGCPSGFDAEDGILNDDAARRLRAEAPRRQKEKVRGGLAIDHLDR